MKRLILASILFLFPFYAQAGFPEGENGYDLKKIEEYDLVNKIKNGPIQIWKEIEDWVEDQSIVKISISDSMLLRGCKGYE